MTSETTFHVKNLPHWPSPPTTFLPILLPAYLAWMSWRVSPFDPMSFFVVSTFLIIVAMLASYVPARRATKVDAAVALRAG